MVLWCSLECTPACQAGGRGFKSRQDRGRIAQSVERAPEKREVDGSMPSPTTANALPGSLVAVTPAATPTAATAARSATPTAAPTTAAKSAATTAARSGSPRPFLCLIHPEGPAVQHGAVQLGYGVTCVLVAAHGYEGEAAGLAGLAVRGHGNLPHFTDRPECIPYRGLRGVKRQVARVQPRGPLDQHPGGGVGSLHGGVRRSLRSTLGDHVDDRSIADQSLQPDDRRWVYVPVLAVA